MLAFCFPLQSMMGDMLEDLGWSKTSDSAPPILLDELTLSLDGMIPVFLLYLVRMNISLPPMKRL
jgi:hypothetical protein